MRSRYLDLAREALEAAPPTHEAMQTCAVSAVSAVSTAALTAPPAALDEPAVLICLTCRRRPTTPRTGYRCPACVERAYAACAAWRPGDGPIILTGDCEP